MSSKLKLIYRQETPDGKNHRVMLSSFQGLTEAEIQTESLVEFLPNKFEVDYYGIHFESNDDLRCDLDPHETCSKASGECWCEFLDELDREGSASTEFLIEGPYSIYEMQIIGVTDDATSNNDEPQESALNSEEKAEWKEVDLWIKFVWHAKKDNSKLVNNVNRSNFTYSTPNYNYKSSTNYYGSTNNGSTNYYGSTNYGSSSTYTSKPNETKLEYEEETADHLELDGSTGGPIWPQDRENIKLLKAKKPEVKVDRTLPTKKITVKSDGNTTDASFEFECRFLPKKITITNPYGTTYETRMPLRCQRVYSSIISCVPCPKEDVCWCRLIDQFWAIDRYQHQPKIRVPLLNSGYSQTRSHYWLIIEGEPNKDNPKKDTVNIRITIEYKYQQKEKIDYNDPYREYLYFPEDNKDDKSEQNQTEKEQIVKNRQPTQSDDDAEFNPFDLFAEIA